MTSKTKKPEATVKAAKKQETKSVAAKEARVTVCGLVLILLCKDPAMTVDQVVEGIKLAGLDPTPKMISIKTTYADTRKVITLLKENNHLK